MNDTDKGIALNNLVQYPGWQVIEEVLDEQVQQAKDKVLSTKSLDPFAVFALTCRAQAMSDLVVMLRYQISALIENAKLTE